MVRNRIFNFYPNEQAEGDDKEEDFLRAQKEVDAWVEKQRNYHKPAYCNGNNQMMKLFIFKNMLYVLKMQVCMNFDNVVIKVFVKNVINLKVI